MVTGGEIGMLVDGSVNLDPDCPLNTSLPAPFLDLSGCTTDRLCAPPCRVIDVIHISGDSLFCPPH